MTSVPTSMAAVEMLAAEVKASRAYSSVVVADTLLAILTELESLRKVPMPEEVAEKVAYLRDYGWLETARFLERQARALAEAQRERDESDAVLWLLANEGVKSDTAESDWADQARARHLAKSKERS